MPLTAEERAYRRKRQRRRGRIILGTLFLIFVAIVALIAWLISLTVHALAPSFPVPDGVSMPAPTTTYPSLNAEEVTGRVSMDRIVLFDVTHNTVLFEQNADVRSFPASTTKLLTAIVACQYGDPNATYTIGSEQEFVVWDASRAYLLEDTPYTLAGMLDGLLLPSGADAAYCLAVNVARYHEKNPKLTDEEAVATFVGYMNDTAAKLGCTNSHFVTPDGYHDDNHYSTANDMLKISQKALKIPEIRTSVSTADSPYGDWSNGNTLICPDSGFYYEYATGLKTGTTPEAGFCLAASAEKNGVQLIAVLFLSDNPDARFLDAKTLFEQGFALADNPPTTATPRLFNYFTTAAPTLPTAALPAA